MKQTIKSTAYSLLVAAILLGGVNFVSAAANWTGPSSTNPPAENIAAPINVGSSAQSKSGLLSLDNSLIVLGTSWFKGTVKISRGTPSTANLSGAPAAGYVLTAVDSYGNTSWQPLPAVCIAQ